MFTNRGARLKSWRLKSYWITSRAAAESSSSSELAAAHAVTVHADDRRRAARLRRCNDALCAVGDAPVGADYGARPISGFGMSDSAGVSVPSKEFQLHAGVVRRSHVSRPISSGDRADHPGNLVGASSRRHCRDQPLVRRRPKDLLFQNGGKVQRLAVKDVTKQSDLREAISSTAAWTTTTS